MKSRLILPAVLGALMISAPAMATGLASKAGTGPSYPWERTGERTPLAVCKDLQMQFDEVSGSHQNSGMFKQAKMLRSEGGVLCSTGKHEEAIGKLQTALRDLGVKPRA